MTLPIVEVRPWRNGDLALLQAAGDSFSAATLTSRFMTGTPVLPPAYLRRLEQLDDREQRRWVQVALVGRKIIGVAECLGTKNGRGSAELAVFVADAWQRRGIGTNLVSDVLTQSLAAGMTHITALSTVGNAATAALLKPRQRPGWRVSCSTRQGVQQYLIEPDSSL
ncbi:hypothetical protein GCM10010435_44700 [Winogradskya consettensis]|uniref:N-acetyltransferase domain-containing protein n=1 Tax=Winogradskya consettensis TaxID=113560 RepID=A0A919T3B1_9ACTN|nr:GNAT family N-acetyltransferase [Actinoplanes consettensis]GIM82752.1 hypothetical protein Aco04nite_83090 [Actinoplanes consettensis]